MLGWRTLIETRGWTRLTLGRTAVPDPVSALTNVVLREYGFSVEEVHRRALTLHAQGEQRARRDRRARK
jgi:hypothetical protein